MRNRSFIVSACTVFTVLLVLLVWWSRHLSTADTTTPSSQTASTPATSELATLPNVSPAQGLPAAASPAITPGSPATPASQTGTTIVAPVPGANTQSPAAPAAAPASGSPTVQQQGMIELDKARRMIRDYHTLMGENPVGTNAEIMKAVMGGNPKQATLGPIEGQQLNAQGELIDRWGTPFFFHQLSGNHMEIHSAGPDKVMGTRDDFVLP